MAGIKQPINDELRQFCWDGKAYSDKPSGYIRIVEGGIDTDHLTIEIHHWTAGVAVIDG